MIFPPRFYSNNISGSALALTAVGRIVENLSLLQYFFEIDHWMIVFLHYPISHLKIKYMNECIFCEMIVEKKNTQLKK